MRPGPQAMRERCLNTDDPCVHGIWMSGYLFRKLLRLQNMSKTKSPTCFRKELSNRYPSITRKTKNRAVYLAMKKTTWLLYAELPRISANIALFASKICIFVAIILSFSSRLSAIRFIAPLYSLLNLVTSEIVSEKSKTFVPFPGGRLNPDRTHFFKMDPPANIARYIV